jgi:hypothetical protein
VGARLDVAAVPVRGEEVLLHQPHALGRDAVSERVIARHAQRLERMAERVHAGAGCDVRRHADGELRIADRLHGEHPRMEDDLLGVRLLVGHDRGAADSDPVPGRGRHRDHRRDRGRIRARPPIADVLKIEHRHVWPCMKRDQLAGIERRAAAERHHAVMPARLVGRDARRKVGFHRIGLHVGEQLRRHARGGEHLHGGRRHRHLGDDRIGDEQRVGNLRSLHGFAEFVRTPGAEAHGGRVIPVAAQLDGHTSLR